MNQITNYYKNNGDQGHGEDFDYAQIKLHSPKNQNEIEESNMLISKCDLGKIIVFKWYLGKSGYPVTYGSFDKKISFTHPKQIHRFLYGDQAFGYVIDHINRNKLDNRRANLRMCTPGENSCNKTKPVNSLNKYKGVSVQKNGKYKASVTKNGVTHAINDIVTEREAAHIYDMMAEELHGQFAAKNFIDPDEIK